MKKFIEVNYVCECGNKQPVIPNDGRPIYKYGVPVYDNVRMICLECGKDMVLQIIKTTQKIETEIL